MTTPLGVPNLPIGALTVETLGEILQDMSAAAMRQRAGERFPDIFNLTTGGDVLNDLTPFGILTAIWAEFNSQIANADPGDVQGPNDLPELMLNFIEELPVIGLLVKFLDALGLNPESVDSFLVPIFEFLDWLWTLVGQEAETILQPIFEFLNWLFTEYGGDVETFLQPIAEFFKWFWDFLTGLIEVTPFQNLVEELVDFLNGFLSAQQFVDLLKSLLQYFSLLTGGNGLPATLLDLIQKIPGVSTLVSIITGKSDEDGALDLGALGAYFRDFEDRVGTGVDKLTAAAEKLLNGRIPVGQISDTTVNLLSQGDFLTSSTVDPAGGWSWDGSQSRTGSGGSLKVDCTGSQQRIYCRQDIKVAAGDRINLNGYVATSNFTSGSMRLSIQPWGLEGSPAVMTAKTVVNGTARTTAASTYQALPELTYTVPAGVTSIQASLVVNCNSTCDVFFDDIRLTKTGVLPQALVTNLLDAIQGILNGAGYVAGQGWQFLETAIGFVTADANDALNNSEETNTVLFDNPAGGETVILDALPVPQLLPSSGSGAILTRTTATPVVATAGRNQIVTGFYNVLEATPLADIEVVSSSGQYVGAYRALSKGWYLITLGFGGRRIASSGWSLAPLLYKGTSLTSLAPYKVGSEVWATSGAWTRYCQGTFSVFLNAGEYVKAGYDVAYGPLTNTSDPVIDADTTGVENYFTIALLSKVSD